MEALTLYVVMYRYNKPSHLGEGMGEGFLKRNSTAWTSISTSTTLCALLGVN